MKPLALKLLLGVIIFFGPLAIEAQCFEYVTSALWSGAVDVKVVGSYAYCAYSTGLTIFNISDPANPIPCSQTYCPGKARRIDVSGNYAYLADGLSGLQIIDISNKLNPSTIGIFNAPGNVNDVFISGNYVYLADDSLGLVIVNITNPINPTFVGNCLITDMLCPLKTAVYMLGHYAYITTTNNYIAPAMGYFYCIDITNLSQPEMVGSCYLSLAGVAICADSNYAYAVANAGVYGEGDFYVIDISDPSRPSVIGQYMLAWNGYDICMAGNIAFIAMTAGFEIIDVSDKTRPTQIADYYHSSSGQSSIFVLGNYAYNVTQSNLDIIDIANLNNPILIGNYDNFHYVEDVAVQGDYAIVADGYSCNLEVLNIANPGNPIPTTTFKLPGYALGISVTMNYAYVADYNYGLKIIDISNPDSLSIVGSDSTCGNAFNVFIQGNYAYLTNLYGFFIFDIENPAEPVRIGQYIDACLYADGLSIEGHYAYVAGGSFRPPTAFKVIDIENPSSPTLVGELPLPDICGIGGIAVSGNYAYVTGTRYFAVIDISNPASPQMIHSFDTLEDGSEIKIVGNYAYVADRFYGIKVFDISDPVSPVLADSYYLPGDVSNFVIENDLCFIADQCAMVILRTNLAGARETETPPSRFSLSQNYPNPFNAATAIKYDLPIASRVILNIFDIQGRKIKTLIDAYQNAGSHQTIWNAANCTSGIYFARIEAGDKRKNIKMVLLK